MFEVELTDRGSQVRPPVCCREGINFEAASIDQWIQAIQLSPDHLVTDQFFNTYLHSRCETSLLLIFLLVFLVLDGEGVRSCSLLLKWDRVAGGAGTRRSKGGSRGRRAIVNFVRAMLYLHFTLMGTFLAAHG